MLTSKPQLLQLIFGREENERIGIGRFNSFDAEVMLGDPGMESVVEKRKNLVREEI